MISKASHKSCNAVCGSAGGCHSNTEQISAACVPLFVSLRGTLQKNGYCAEGGNATACQKFPVVIGETGSNFTHPQDKAYFDSMVKFMQRSPPADTYPTSSFNRWFW